MEKSLMFLPDMLMQAGSFVNKAALRPAEFTNGFRRLLRENARSVTINTEDLYISHKLRLTRGGYP
jgi:hypothetical protein